MTISSRTPEGDPNRCPVCGHRCRIEPACLTADAPCPRCGHLLWFREARVPKPAPELIPEVRPKRPQGQPPQRDSREQAQRLVRRLIRRAEQILGPPDAPVGTALFQLREPHHAERLLSLLPRSRSWAELLAMWLDQDVKV